MNDIQTPEWIKESIIKGLNRKKHATLKHALSVSWRVAMAFAADKYIRASSIADGWLDGLVVWAWKHLHNGGRT